MPRRIYNSIGLTQAEADALELAWDSGILMVSARGNTGESLTIYCPAFSDRVIAVSGTTLNDELWEFSSWNHVDLAAPALPIYNIASSNLYDPPYVPT